MNTTEFLTDNFDVPFRAQGLDSKKILSPLSRIVRGVYDARPFEIVFSPRGRTKYYSDRVRIRKYIGHQLSFSIQAPLGVRMSISRSNTGSKTFFAGWLEKSFRLRELPMEVPELGHLRVLTTNPDWTQRLLQDSQILEMLRTELFIEEAKDTTISLLPDMLTYSQRLSFTTATRERLLSWSRCLSIIVDVAERLGKPEPVERLTTFEKRMRSLNAHFIKRPILCAVLLFIAMLVILLLLTPFFIISLPVTMPLLTMWVIYGWLKKSK